MTQQGLTLSLRIEGIEDLLRRLGPEAFRRALVMGMRLATLHAEGEIKERTPAQTGRLAAAWTTRMEEAGSTIRGIVGNNTRYGPYVNYGTGVYVGRGLIRPRTASVLRFVVDGQTIFRRWVRGQPGQHFAEKGLAAAKPGAERIILRQIEAALEGKG